jgi:hypothetical protein
MPCISSSPQTRDKSDDIDKYFLLSAYKVELFIVFPFFYGFARSSARLLCLWATGKEVKPIDTLTATDSC